MDKATRPLIVAAAGLATLGGWLLFRSISSPTSPSRMTDSDIDGLRNKSTPASSPTSSSSSGLVKRGNGIIDGAIIVVDPLSTGGMLAQYIINR
jgi:hypothetical protein